MQGLDWLMWGATFITGTFFVYGVLYYVNNRRLLKQRFNKTPAAAAMPLYKQSGEGFVKRILEWVGSFGKYASTEKQDSSKLRTTLIQAGFRHPKNTAIFYGLQALGAFFLPVPYLMLNAVKGTMASGNLMMCLMLAGGGFYLPILLLRFLLQRRQDRIDKALPDVLDLLIVCMEAGLSLQSTINRVADEVRPISEEMYLELTLTNAELRTGITRELALRNLADRTGVQNVSALTGMMIQSDRMGTSLSQALRVHSSFLRIQRAQKAEEVAAKMPVKIMFPMLMFIFPAVFIVVLGPAIVHMMRANFLGMGK
jgi:tight adherence protein C